MKNKLECVLLIDDDAPTNFLSSLILEEVDCTNHVHVAQSGRKALDYLSSLAVNDDPETVAPCPELIFLDINMPAMNGWEFLEKYTEINLNQPCHPIIIMLTTSVNPEDKLKAVAIPLVSGFESKPLTCDIVEKLIGKYFSDRKQ
jgi:CheY-like chemotaxis protein